MLFRLLARAGRGESGSKLPALQTLREAGDHRKNRSSEGFNSFAIVRAGRGKAGASYPHSKRFARQGALGKIVRALEVSIWGRRCGVGATRCPGYWVE